MSAETQRLAEDASRARNWKRWGPYLSERQWGTVREDYSPYGNAWDYFSHDQARSRAYRWGEDGLGGISDDHQVLCFALALWNGRDPILKERAFGLTVAEWAGPVRVPPRKQAVRKPKLRPYSWTSRSPATFDTPNRLCTESSIDIDSSMPRRAKGWSGATDQRVSLE